MSPSRPLSPGQSITTLFHELPKSIKRHSWDASIPRALRPLVRAYLLGYASSVLPRIPALLGLLLKQRRSATNPKGASQHPQKSVLFIDALRRLLLEPLHWQRFPTFCAALVGGSTILEVQLCQFIRRVAILTQSQAPLNGLIDRFARGLSGVLRIRYTLNQPFTP